MTLESWYKHLSLFVLVFSIAGGMSTYANTAHSSPVNIDTRDYWLVTTSERGNTTPATGTNVYAWMAAVTASAPNSIESGVLWYSSGWTGSGSVQAVGMTNTTGNILLSNIVSSISWHWATGFAITNVDSRQRFGTTLVDIDYDILSSVTDAVPISLVISIDGTNIPAATVTGAVGTNVLPGLGKTATWDAGKDWSNMNASLSFRILHSIETDFAAEDSADIDTRYDSDGDGIPNEWEFANGLNPFVSNAYGSNFDGDWMTDVEEYIADTKPRNSNSFFPELIVTGSSFKTMALVVDPSSTSRFYKVEWTTNLINSPVQWHPYMPLKAGTGAAVSFLVTNDVHSRVYRTGVQIAWSDLGFFNGMALIPGGSFSMGDSFSPEGDASELPVHTVTFDPIYMDATEVTKEAWDYVYSWAITNDYSFDNTGSGMASNHPVQTVNWYDTVKWANARSQMEGLIPCYSVSGTTYKTGTFVPDCNWSASGYRLPTEAEWEKAARGGISGQRFPWSITNTISHSQANYNAGGGESYDDSDGAGVHPDYNDNGSPYTSPVGSFAPNDYGLYDMAGNVWEWCWDWYSSTYYSSSPGTDPRGPATGSVRVRRGGSWISYAGFSRNSSRGGSSPANAFNNMGFRLVRSAE